MRKKRNLRTHKITIAVAIAIIVSFCLYSHYLVKYTAEAQASNEIKIVEVSKQWDINDIQKEIIRQSSLYDVQSNIMLKIAKCESNFNPEAMNKTSTATGLYQIINSTWKQFKCTGGITDVEDNIKCAMKLASLDGYHQWNASKSCWNQ